MLATTAPVRDAKWTTWKIVGAFITCIVGADFLKVCIVWKYGRPWAEKKVMELVEKKVKEILRNTNIQGMEKGEQFLERIKGHRYKPKS